jgi:ribosomal protein L24
MHIGDAVVVRSDRRKGWQGVIAVAEPDDDMVLIEFDCGRLWHRREELEPL